MHKDKILEIATLLSGKVVQLGFQADVIDRISSVVLFREDGSTTVIAIEIIDVEDRLEVGQLSVVERKSKFVKDLAVKLDYSPNGIVLTEIWVLASRVGDLISGVTYRDSIGGVIEVAASAEIGCFYIDAGAIRTPSDPEYSKDQYRIVRI